MVQLGIFYFITVYIFVHIEICIHTTFSTFWLQQFIVKWMDKNSKNRQFTEQIPSEFWFLISVPGTHFYLPFALHYKLSQWVFNFCPFQPDAATLFAQKLTCTLVVVIIIWHAPRELQVVEAPISLNIVPHHKRRYSYLCQ